MKLAVLSSLFIAFNSLVVYLTAIVAIVITGLTITKSPSWFVVFGGVGILVGVFSDFKRNLFFRIAHYVCAIGGFILLGLSYWLSFDKPVFTIIIAISALLASSVGRKKIWALELVLTLEIFVGLFYLAHKLM